MMGAIFAIMLLAGVAAGVISLAPQTILDGLLLGANDAFALLIKLAGSYMLWMGLMRVAAEAGLIDGLAKRCAPVFKLLFPKAGKAVAPIALNLAANFFGMGSAATPFGLEAMRELEISARKEGVKEGVASDEMVMFLSLNSSAIELLPTGVLALRAAAASADAYCVVTPTFIASIIAAVVAVAVCIALNKLT